MVNVWIAHRWTIRVFVFFKSCTEVNSFLCLNYVNSCIPKIVRHGTSLHRICPKLLINSSPIRLESIDSSPSQLEPQTFFRRPTAKLFGSSHIRLESQVYVRRPTLKLIGSRHSQLESSSSVRRPSLNPFGSSPRLLSFGQRRTG